MHSHGLTHGPQKQLWLQLSICFRWQGWQLTMCYSSEHLNIQLLSLHHTLTTSLLSFLSDHHIFIH